MRSGELLEKQISPHPYCWSERRDRDGRQELIYLFNLFLVPCSTISSSAVMIETDQPSAKGIHAADRSLVVRCQVDEDIGVDQMGHLSRPGVFSQSIHVAHAVLNVFAILPHAGYR